MMRIVIPLAGKDPRFDIFASPKPLVQVNGVPLIKRCTDSLGQIFSKRNEIVFLVRAEDVEKHNICNRLKEIYGSGNSVNVVVVESDTEGAACTVLLAKELINNDDELLIYLADIYFASDISRILENPPSNVDGIIPTFKSSNPKYSYARVGEDGEVLEVAEKKVISDNASAGFYWFAHGKDFVSAAESMIAKDLRVNNSFFICPVYNELIETGKKVIISESEFKFGLGSPDEIKSFGDNLEAAKHD